MYVCMYLCMYVWDHLQTLSMYVSENEAFVYVWMLQKYPPSQISKKWVGDQILNVFRKELDPHPRWLPRSTLPKNSKLNWLNVRFWVHVWTPDVYVCMFGASSTSVCIPSLSLHGCVFEALIRVCVCVPVCEKPLLSMYLCMSEITSKHWVCMYVCMFQKTKPLFM